MTMDKYDKAIEWLVANMDEASLDHYSSLVEKAWDGEQDEAWCLFQNATPTGGRPQCRSGCGCLTQIRRPENPLEAWTPELTAEIRADERIPFDVLGMKQLRGDELREALQVFAIWQRRLDREIRGVVNV